jgi:hypothetical protein
MEVLGTSHYAHLSTDYNVGTPRSVTSPLPTFSHLSELANWAGPEPYDVSPTLSTEKRRDANNGHVSVSLELSEPPDSGAAAARTP